MSIENTPEVTRHEAESPERDAGAVGGLGVTTTAVPSLDTERWALASDLAKIEETMSRLESRYAEDIDLVHPELRADAVNLTHYLALRQGDERSLQRRLGERGLSSLGRCEPHVLATVESVRFTLDSSTSLPVPASLSFEAGRGAARPQHGRPLRAPATWEGATDHGDASQRSSHRLPARAPPRRVRNGRGTDQRRPRRPRRMGAHGRQRSQGIRRSDPTVPDLHGSAGTQDAYGASGRGPARGPVAAPTRPSRSGRRTLSGQARGRAGDDRRGGACSSGRGRMARCVVHPRC